MKDEMLSVAKADLMRLMKRRGGVTIKEAAASLDLAASTIRQHLSGLEIDGLIDKRINRQGVGRPSKMYFLTDKAEPFFENREGTLLAELIRFWISTGDQEKIEEFFSNSNDQWLASWQRRIALAPESEKLILLEQLLQDWGYIPEFDTDTEGRLIIEFFHCPYPNIAELVPYQCAGEKRLLEHLTGKTLCQQCNMPDGNASCRFVAIDEIPSAAE